MFVKQLRYICDRTKSCSTNLIHIYHNCKEKYVLTIINQLLFIIESKCNATYKVEN